MGEAVSPLADWYAGHAAAWAMVFCRVLGLFVLAPVLGGLTVPVQFKALLAAMMATAVYGLMPAAARSLPAAGLGDLGLMIATEVLIGAGLGAVAALPLIAVEIAGQVIGYQLGFSVAAAANPELDINLDAIGMMLFIMTMSVFVLMGGLDETVMMLLRTFGDIPPGGVALGDAPLEAYAGLLAGAMDLALRLAAPVIGVVLLSTMALGFMMKTAPQFNVMSVGFAISIALGVPSLIFALFTSNDAIGDFIVSSLTGAASWAHSLVDQGGANGG